IRWDVPASAPSGTRVACSLGDGLLNKIIGVPSDVIPRVLFAVGPLRRSPPWDVKDPEQQQHCDEKRKEIHQQSLFVYWFGSPPYEMERVSSMTERLFGAIAGFFGDNENDFRVFMRRVHDTHGGRGARNSFMLEYYSPGIDEEQTEE